MTNQSKRLWVAIALAGIGHLVLIIGIIESPSTQTQRLSLKKIHQNSPVIFRLIKQEYNHTVAASKTGPKRVTQEKKPPPVNKQSVDAISKQPYSDRILSHVNQFKFYPSRSRLRQEEGQVTLLISILPSGVLEKATLMTPSKHHLLNSAALKTVKKASPYPVPSTRQPKHVIVTLSYELQT